MKCYLHDCVEGAKEHLSDESVDLMICDPPFGIGESSFSTLYNRKPDQVIAGYREAPEDYLGFTHTWMEQARRVIKPHGSLYVVSGHTHLLEVMQAARDLGFYQRNHIIWKYNFGVYTTRKYVTSHYHILYFTKNEKSRPTFNLNCRFTSNDRDQKGSLRYRDVEDVWVIPREYHKGHTKNSNKLPDALIEKMVLYSSNPGDMVCDFFLGNFTTALVASRLGRRVSGFELNPESYNIGIGKLRETL